AQRQRLVLESVSVIVQREVTLLPVWGKSRQGLPPAVEQTYRLRPQAQARVAWSHKIGVGVGLHRRHIATEHRVALPGEAGRRRRRQTGNKRQRRASSQ